MSNIFIIFCAKSCTKSIISVLFVILLISSATNFVINPTFAQENGTNSTSTNSTSTNSTSTNSTSTNSTSTNSTSTNSTSTNSTSTNSTIINFTNTNATNYNYTNANSTNSTLMVNSTSSNSNNATLVQPLIIVPSNSTIPLNNTSAPVVHYDVDTIHNAVAAEINIQNRTINTTSIDNDVSVSTGNSSADSVKIRVSASNQTGPKVILFNLDNTTINVANLKYLGVIFDGKQIEPATNVDAILHAKNTDSPHFAIIITQTGAQILVLVPHFSTHTIEITNLNAVTATPTPEYGPITISVLMISIISIILISIRSSLRFIHRY